MILTDADEGEVAIMCSENGISNISDQIDLSSIMVERYFSDLYQHGWARVESLLTKRQIENEISADFIGGLFLGSMLAGIEKNDQCENPITADIRDLLYERFGGMSGLIGELVRRMQFEWEYIPTAERFAEDSQPADLSLLFVRCN